MVKSDKDLVSLVRCSVYHPGTVRESLAAIFRPWGGLGAFVKPGDRILIKPNLLAAALPEEAVTTHPAVVRGLAEMIKEAGGRVFIGDSSQSDPLEKINRVTGMEEVIRQTGAEQILFNEVKLVRFEGKKLRFLPLAASLDRVDLIINTAKLKTHTLTGLTAAVKNMYGCIAGKHKKRLHLEHPRLAEFAHLLLDIYLAVKPAFSIVDAVVAMEGTGPRSGRPRRVGLLLGGTNGIAVDSAAAALIGFRPDQVPTIAAARRRGLDGAELSRIEIRGVSLEEAAVRDFDLGAVTGGSYGRLVTRFPGSWFRNFMQRRRPFPAVNMAKCTGCGVCFQNCPPQVIRLQENKAHLDLSRCIRCYCCQELCPYGAIQMLP